MVKVLAVVLSLAATMPMTKDSIRTYVHAIIVQNPNGGYLVIEGANEMSYHECKFTDPFTDDYIKTGRLWLEAVGLRRQDNYSVLG